MVSKVNTNAAAFGRNTVQVARRYDGVLLVAINRPDVLNALSDDGTNLCTHLMIGPWFLTDSLLLSTAMVVYEDMMDCLKLAEEDDTLHAVVLTGVGKYFSSGADLQDSRGLGFGDTSSLHVDESGRCSSSSAMRMCDRPAGRFMMAILNFSKLLCAAVNGPAVGIAVPLLLHCDLVHLHPAATLWAPFARLALVPEFCASITFRATHGLAKANELLLLGTRISADEAVHMYGFGSRVVPADAALSPFESGSLADQMCDTIGRKLLSLSSGDITAKVFQQLIKNPWKNQLKEICSRELSVLDERFRSGQVQEAVRRMQIGSSSRSKL
jgi:enoyl-CoA hydratase/carnithine racemase